MTPKQKAFLLDNLSEFGYGEIARHRTRWDNVVGDYEYPVPTFTLNQHERYAYNDNPFQYRDSPNSIFTVEYGQPAEGGDLASCYDEALIMIGQMGRIAIPYSDTILSRGLRQAAGRLGLDFVELHMNLEGMPAPLSKSFGPKITVDVSCTEFFDFAEKFGRITLCRDPIKLYRAIFSDISTVPVIYESDAPHLTDENFDRWHRHRVGPAYWTLRNYEDEYALHRYLHYNGRSGVPDFYTWTPNMMREFYNSAGMRDFLSNYGDDTAAPHTGREVIEAILPEAFRIPELGRMKYYDWPFDNELSFGNETVKHLTDNARDRAHRASMEITQRTFFSHYHHIPLHRLLDHFHIEYDFQHGKYDEIYGTVE